MKRKGLLNKCAILFATVLTVGSIGILPVKAGASTIVVDNSSFKEKIDDTIWSNPDSIVASKNNMLVFPKDSTGDTRLITKTVVRTSAMEDELVNAQTTIRLESLPQGEKFIFALGLSSIEGLPAESGNVEVQFVNNGGVKASVVAYGDEGEQEVIPTTSVGRLNSDIKVEVSITKAQVLTLKIGGRVIGKSALPVDGEGRIGFLQTGSCVAKVKKVKFVSYRYETPENSNIYEDFEKGTINQNLLTSKMIGFPAQYLPCYARVEEYKDSQVFMCNNSGGTYLGTLQQYSNFELTFDIPYIQNVAQWNEAGDAVKLISGEVVIGWGYQEPNPSGAADYMQAEQSVSLRSGTKIVPKGYSDLTVTPETHKFFSPGCKRGVSVKLSMIDAEAVISLKWMDETKWTEVLRYKTGTQTPLGYIQIWALTPGNVAIDNLKIVNKDANPKQIKVDEKYELLERVEDYEYKKDKVVYKDFNAKEASFNGYLLIPATASFCAIVFGAVLATVLLRKKKKGGSSNE